MKMRLLTFVALLGCLSAPYAKAQLTATLVKLGDSPSGSVYQYTISYNHLYYEPGGGGYGTAALSGVAGAYMVDGSYPAGNSFLQEAANNSTPLGSFGPLVGTFTIPTGSTGGWTLAARTTAGGGYTSSTEGLGVSAAGSYDPGATKKSFLYNFTNGAEYAVRYVIEEDGVIVVNELVQPGQTVSGAREGANTGTFVDKVFVPAEFSDGGWVEQNLGPTGTGGGATSSGNTYIVLPSGTTTSNHAPGASPVTPINTRSITPTTPGIPGAGQILPASQTIWKENTGTDLLTNSVYKQGVDKVVAEIKGAPVTQTTFDATADPDYETSMAKASVDGLLSKVPTAPTIVAPAASAGVFSFTFTPAGMSSAQTFEMDLSAYDTPIDAFKLLVRAGLALWFYFLVVRTVRDSFA